MFDNLPLLTNGFAVAITGYHILLMMVGVFLGILVGVLRVWGRQTASRCSCR